jgi:hypothetical protein
MSERAAAVAEPEPTATVVRGGLLQRKCACGGGSGCKPCQQAGNEVDNQPRRNWVVGDVPSIVHEVLESSGRPLDTQSRVLFEARFGHDLSHIRVHADTQSSASAQAIGADAYTFGHHIVFRDPETPDNRSGSTQLLLAHELAHSFQQRPVGSIPSLLRLSPPSDPLEREADSVADHASHEASVAPPATIYRKASVPPDQPDLLIHNTELGGLSVGNFDFHLRDCHILVWVWLKFKFARDIKTEEQARFKARFIAAVHKTWAHTGYAVTGTPACPCHTIPIEIHCEENAKSYYHKLVDVEKKSDDQRRPMVISDINVNLDTPDETLGHEFGHVLGLYDEYDGGFFENIMFWHKNKPDDPSSLMNLGSELRPRYFESYRRAVQKTARPDCNYSVSSPTPPVSS